MRKLDRLDWRCGARFFLFGVSIGIRSNDSKILDTAINRIPPGSTQQDSAVVEHLFSIWVGGPKNNARRQYHLLYYGSALLLRTRSLDEVYDTLENYLILSTAYHADDRYLFVHSGVVAWKGRAIVIPGRSYSGKSTLVSAFIEAGAEYYSDEMAILDREGLVHAFPVDISRRTSSGIQRISLNKQSSISAAPAPISTILVTNYASGAVWRPKQISSGRALISLLENTVAARKDPDRYLPILSKAVSSAVSLKGRRGEAIAVVDHVLSNMN